MIRVAVVPQPDGFAAIKAKGDAWLETHRTQDPPNLWSKFRAHLATGFQDRCGYTAMYTPSGQVDHYRCQREHRQLIYEWSNYRYCSGDVNSRKKNLDVLDPYEIETPWFEILYPSLQLVLTPAVPKAEEDRAKLTITKLGLCNGEFVLKARRTWLRMYGQERLTIEGLRVLAPLLAGMVARHGLTPQQVARTFLSNPL